MLTCDDLVKSQEMVSTSLCAWGKTTYSMKNCTTTPSVKCNALAPLRALLQQPTITTTALSLLAGDCYPFVNQLNKRDQQSTPLPCSWVNMSMVNSSDLANPSKGRNCRPTKTEPQ